MTERDRPLKDAAAAAAESRRQAEVYVSLLAPDIVRTFQELGLTPELADTLKVHLDDLTVVVNHGTGTSRLSIGSETDGPDTVWRREAVVSTTQIEANRKTLTAALEETAPGSVADTDINKLALDWIMFELAADALGNCVYMLDRYGKYVPDLDLQARLFGGELAVTSRYVDAIGKADAYSRAKVQSMHRNFRAGFGLVMLRDDLLLMGIQKAQQAAWAIEYIRKNAPQFNSRVYSAAIAPLQVEELGEYVAASTERESRRPDMPEIAATVVELVRRRR